jgi:hypothetical protein
VMGKSCTGAMCSYLKVKESSTTGTTSPITPPTESKILEGFVAHLT